VSGHERKEKVEQFMRYEGNLKSVIRCTHAVRSKRGAYKEFHETGVSPAALGEVDVHLQTCYTINSGERRQYPNGEQILKLAITC
jgi:hypothetical protein